MNISHDGVTEEGEGDGGPLPLHLHLSGDVAGKKPYSHRVDRRVLGEPPRKLVKALESFETHLRSEATTANAYSLAKSYTKWMARFISYSPMPLPESGALDIRVVVNMLGTLLSPANLGRFARQLVSRVVSPSTCRFAFVAIQKFTIFAKAMGVYNHSPVVLDVHISSIVKWQKFFRKSESRRARERGDVKLWRAVKTFRQRDDRSSSAEPGAGGSAVLREFIREHKRNPVNRLETCMDATRQTSHQEVHHHQRLSFCMATFVSTVEVQLSKQILDVNWKEVSNNGELSGRVINTDGEYLDVLALLVAAMHALQMPPRIKQLLSLTIGDIQDIAEDDDNVWISKRFKGSETVNAGRLMAFRFDERVLQACMLFCVYLRTSKASGDPSGYMLTKFDGTPFSPSYNGSYLLQRFQEKHMPQYEVAGNTEIRRQLDTLASAIVSTDELQRFQRYNGHSPSNASARAYILTDARSGALQGHRIHTTVLNKCRQ